MRSLRHCFVALLALACPVQAICGAAAGALDANGAPPGFTEIASPREALVDVYFGGEKIAEALIETKPGSIRFRTPSEIIAKLPPLAAASEVEAALAADLPSNAGQVCLKTNAGSCGSLSPDSIGLIYDEDRFRVDLFINPRLLKTLAAAPDPFLPTPSAPLSLTSAVGVAASGSIGGTPVYNLQNRTVIALHNARLRTSNSIASKLGWVVDDFVGEVDHRDLRYSAGLFWAPGDDFIGQRRIIGGGVGTQFDTRADRDNLGGTPLIVFLPQAARVEILVDGRLVSARSYPAGNNELDTSALGDGSYPILLRIHERSGAVRDDQRFFVKSAHIAPKGHPVYFAYAGVLANTRAHRPVSVSKTLFYQAGIAWRIDNAVALDLSAMGTQHKAILEAGGWLIARPVRARAAAIASSAGDLGGLLQLSSSGHGLVNFNFDLRRIWSRDGRPLIPLSPPVETFDSVVPTGLQLATGSYTQAIGSIGVRLGSGYLSVVGTYRKDRRLRSDYSIGPSVNLPLVTRSGLQILFEASAQRTRSITSAFAGVRLLYTAGHMSMAGRVGQSFEDERDGAHDRTLRQTGSVSAQYSGETAGGALLTGEVGADRDLHSSALRAGGTLLSDLGNARAEFLQNLEGGSGTQYDLSFQSGLALSRHAATLGARQTEPSAIIVSVRGDASDVPFKVLVDDAVRGEVRSGQHLSLFVAPYRTYRVRLLPVDAAPVEYDTAARNVTLYPGNVAGLSWQAQSIVTVFAQAIGPSGEPIADGLVESGKAVAQTDTNGYFQIDVRRGDEIMINKDGAPACRVRLPALPSGKDFASVGKVVCR